MNRTEKQATITSLHNAIKDQGMLVIAHQNGLTVAESTDLRRKVRAAGANLQVTKNSLASKAIEGTQYANLDGLLKGPTVLAWAKDPLAVAKVIVDYAKSNEKLKLVGGGFGPEMLDANRVKALGNLPSLDALRGKLVGLLQAPGAQIARVLAARAKKDGGEAAA